MNLTNEQIRLLIMHEWKSGLNGKEVTARINEIWGEGTVGQSTVYKWISRFQAGEESLKDDPRSGRPIEVDRHAVLAAIEETPSLTTRILAEDFDCDHKTIVNILHELGKIWKKTRWVPHELTDTQKRNRVRAAQVLLARQAQAPFLHLLVTGDEKWVSFRNPNPHNE